MDAHPDVGFLIRALRQDRGLTQQALATAIGVSRPAMVLYENGMRRIPLFRLRAIAKVLETPISRLLGETPNGDVLPVTNPAEQALVELYREFPPSLREKLLQLFSVSIKEDEAGQTPRDPGKSRRIAHVRSVEQAA